MPKITTQTLKDAGFSAEMFAKDAGTFDPYLTGVINEQAAILEGRIGTGLYNTATSPTKDYVARVEKLLCIAELWDRRIAVKLGSVVGGGEDLYTTYEQKARQKASDEAENLISRLGNGDFAFGYNETDHFDASQTGAA